MPKTIEKENELKSPTFRSGDMDLLIEASEKFASALISYRIAFDNSLDKHSTSSGRSKTEALERLITRGGLARALMSLAEEVRRWAVWREFGLSGSTQLFPAENIQIIVLDQDLRRAIASSFDYRGQRYTIQIGEPRKYLDNYTDLFEIQFFRREAMVLGLSAVDGKDDRPKFGWTSITCFAPGDWIQALTEIEAYINRGLEAARRAQ